MSASLPILLLLALAAAAPRAFAQAAPDSAAADSLGGYLGTLSDSTDRYFGMSSAPADTAGFDSLLAAGLARPGDDPGSRRLRPSFAPWLAFNRVDGALWGASASVGTRPLGRLDGRLGYAAGPNDWLGGGRYTKLLGRRGAPTQWSLRLEGGRFTRALDLDRRDSWLATWRALLGGSDRQHYLRTDGAGASVTRESPTLRVALAARDELESPLVTTTTWNLFDRTPVVFANRAATLGRVRELGIEVAARVPGAPAWVEVESRFADDAWGSDLTYGRHRAAVAAELPVGRIASLVPQATYGLLNGDAFPQSSFYLGGAHSIRSIPGATFGGTRRALASLQLLSAPDLLDRLHVPHPASMPIQAGLFGGIGAVWGRDPDGGPGSPDDLWPARGAWASEAGASLLYRPGIPDVEGYVRFDYAWPIGPGDREPRVAVYYATPIDLLRPPGR